MLRPGKYTPKQEFGPIRELTRDEMEILKAPRPKSQTVATLRDSHHRVARLFAMGLRPAQVAAKSGYSCSRLTILLRDPSFTNLVESYRNQVDEAWRAEIDEFYELAAQTKMVAERMIADQLEDAEAAGEPVPLKTLIAIVADRADRTGHGKKTTNVNVNVDLGSRLERARLRASQVIDGQVTASPALAPRFVESPGAKRVPAVAEPKLDRAEGPLPVMTRRAIG